MTGKPGRAHRPAIGFLQNSWVVLSTLVIVVIAGSILYALLGLDRFFAPTHPPARDVETSENTADAYSADGVDELCDELDTKLGEETAEHELNQSSTSGMCFLLTPKGNNEVGEFGLKISTTFWSTIEAADENFDTTETGIIVTGPWEMAIAATPDSNDPTVRYFTVKEANLTIRITQFTDPSGSISDSEYLTLVTTYAEQVLDAYRM